MKGRDGDPRNRFGSSLDVIKQSQQIDRERRRSLLSKPAVDPPTTAVGPLAEGSFGTRARYCLRCGFITARISGPRCTTCRRRRARSR